MRRKVTGIGLVLFALSSCSVFGFQTTQKVTGGDLAVWLETNGLQISCREHRLIVGSYIRVYGPNFDITKELYHSFSSNVPAKIVQGKDGGSIEVADTGRGTNLLYKIELKGSTVHVTLDCRVNPDVELGGMEYTGAFVSRWIVPRAKISYLADGKRGKTIIPAVLTDPIAELAAGACEEIDVATSPAEIQFRGLGQDRLSLSDNRKNPWFEERDHHLWLNPVVAFGKDRHIHHEMEITIIPQKGLISLQNLPVVQCPPKFPQREHPPLDPPAVVFPVPQRLDRLPGVWKGIPYIRGLDAGSKRVAAVLQADIKDELSLNLPVVDAVRADRPAIVLRITVPGPPAREQSYVLDSTGKDITITAGDERGLFYGTQTLMQIGQASEDGLRVPRLHIEDWPVVKLRAAHPARLWPTASLGHFKKYFKLLSRYKYNMIIIEDSGAIRFPELPYAWDASGGFTPDQVRGLVAYGRGRYLEIVPQLQCLGHADEWLARNPDDFTKFPWLKACFEDPNTRKDLCVSNPKTLEVIFKTMDAINDVFGHPKFFHIGFDESFGFATCPRCKEAGSKAGLMANYLKAIYARLKSKGQTLMMWHDMLLGKAEGGYDDRGKGVRDSLPKDIMVCAWEYDYTRLDQFRAPVFKREKFEVMTCPYKTPQNIYVSAQLARKYKLDFMSTNWIFFPSACSFEALAQIGGEVFGSLLGGVYAWNPDKPAQKQLTPTMLMETFGEIPPAIPGRPFTLIDLAPAANQKFDLTGFSGIGGNEKTSESGAIVVSGIPFQIAFAGSENVASVIKARAVKHIPIGKAVSHIDLLAAIAEPLGANVNLDVQLRFADGKIHREVLTGNENIAMLNDPQLLMYFGRPLDNPCAWIGLLRKEKNTAVGSLSVVRITNPDPTLTIENIDILSRDTQPVGVILFAVTTESPMSGLK